MGTAAGVGFAVWGAAPLFVFNALSFLVLAVTVMTLPLAGRPAPARHVAFWQDFLGGWRVALTQRVVLAVLAVSLVSNLAWRAVEVALVPWARALPALGAAGYGLLFTALTLGGVLGALIVPKLRLEQQSASKLVAAFGLSGLPLLALAAWPTLSVALAAMFTCGVLLDVVAITTASVLQTRVDRAYLGRVFAAVNVSCALGVLPVLAGLTSYTAGVGHAGVITTAGTLTVLAAMLLALAAKASRPRTGKAAQVDAATT